METHSHFYEVSADSHYEMGVRIGETLKQQTLDWVDKRASLPGFGEKVDQAKKYLEFTQVFFPQYIQELLGQSHSLGVSLFEIWAFSLEEELDFLDPPPEKCTTVVTNEGDLFGHTEDADLGSEESLVILKRKLKEATTLELYFLGTLGGDSVSINSYGYASTRNTLADYDTQYGIPKATIARFLSETKHPEADLAKVDKLKKRMGSSLIFISKLGRLVAAETTAKQVAVYYPQTPFVHTNHYILPEMKRFDHNPNTTATFDRFNSATALVKPEMTSEEMKILMSDTSLGSHKSIFNERTIARSVLNWSDQVVWLWLQRESSKGWVEYPLDFI
jgi:predicted choloylglycine hydrolase